MAHSAVQANFISSGISAELSRAGLDIGSNSKIRLELEKHAVVTGVRDPVVRILLDGDRSIAVADRIQELRNDPKFVDQFPEPPKKVSKTDMRTMSENFEAISQGKVRVE